MSNRRPAWRAEKAPDAEGWWWARFTLLHGDGPNCHLRYGAEGPVLVRVEFDYEYGELVVDCGMPSNYPMHWVSFEGGGCQWAPPIAPEGGWHPLPEL